MNQPNQTPKIPTKLKKLAISTTSEFKQTQIEKVEIKKITGKNLIQLKNFLKRTQLAHKIKAEDLKTNAHHDQRLIEDLKKLASTHQKKHLNSTALTEFEKKYGGK